MISGRVIQVDRLADVVRLHVECTPALCRHDIDIYPTPETVFIRPGDLVWSQANQIIWTDSDRCVVDRVLWRIRKDEGGRRWTLEEAKRGGPETDLPKLPRKMPPTGGMACVGLSTGILGLGWGWFLLVAAFLIGAVRERP